MGNDFLIRKWAMIRRNELVDIPDSFAIHADFLGKINVHDFRQAFEEIGKLFSEIYLNQGQQPETFGLPLYKENEYNYFSKEAREVRTAPWKFFYFFLYLFATGEQSENQLKSTLADVKKEYRYYKVKEAKKYLEVLEQYGFAIQDTKAQICISYPPNSNIIVVLSEVAKKVKRTQLNEVGNCLSHQVSFANGFISWNYKILEENKNTCMLGKDYQLVADKMHDKADQKVIEHLNHIFLNGGYTWKTADPNEGPSIRYFNHRSTFDYALTSIEGKLFLELRIRKPEKCMELLKVSSEEIMDMFRQTEEGCQNRLNGSCKCGIKYKFENAVKWHCGCCGAPFKLHPVEKDIPHYLNLVEKGI